MAPLSFILDFHKAVCVSEIWGQIKCGCRFKRGLRGRGTLTSSEGYSKLSSRNEVAEAFCLVRTGHEWVCAEENFDVYLVDADGGRGRGSICLSHGGSEGVFIDCEIEHEVLGC